MKMIINSKELKSILKNINILSKKRNIPELDGVKITVENPDSVLFESADLESSIKVIGTGTVQSAGSCIISAKKLYEVSKNVLSDSIIIESVDDNIINVYAGEEKIVFLPLKLNLIDIMYFTEEINIKTTNFIHLLQSTIIFSKDKTIQKKCFNGACLNFNRWVSIVCTDTKRLSKMAILEATGSTEKKVIIPKKIIKNLIEIFKTEKTDTLKVSFAKNIIRITGKRNIFTTLLIDDIYHEFDTNKLIREENCVEVEFNTENFIYQMNLIKISDMRVVFEIRENEIIAKTPSQNINMGGDISNFNCKKEFTFNSKFILEAVKNIGEKKFKIYFDKVCCLIKTEAPSSNYLHWIVAIRTPY